MKFLLHAYYIPLFIFNKGMWTCNHCYCCCKCCCKCWKCFGLEVVSIRSSHTSLSKCRCSSHFGNLMSCSFLTPWLCSFSCFSYGDVIYGISCFCSLDYLFYGDVICGIIVVCLTTCTIVGIALTTIGIIDGSTLPFIIFYALKYVFSCSLFTSQRHIYLLWA